MPRKNRAATLAEVLAFVATAPLGQVEVAVEALRTIMLIRKATDGTPLAGVAAEAVGKRLGEIPPKVVPPRKRAPKPVVAPPARILETPVEVGVEVGE